MNKKNILVGQSGGPTAVINGSLYGVICEGARHSDAVGCVYGLVLKKILGEQIMMLELIDVLRKGDLFLNLLAGRMILM